MKNIHAHPHSKNDILLKLSRLTGIFVLVIITGIFSLNAQKPSDSLILATDGTIEATVIAGDYLYIGGTFTHLGEKVGPVAFFKNGSSGPEKNKPIFGDLRPYWMSDKVFAVFPDGNGGWFVGGTFDKVNNQKHNIFVHILPDNSIDRAWDLNWNPGGHINVIKKEKNYLYIGGTMSITDQQGNLHKHVCRIDLGTREVDPVWNPGLSDAGHIDKIEIGKDKIFLSGWVGKVEGFPQDALVTVDKITGKRLSFPTTSSVTAMKLMGDTLLIGQQSMYWSYYPDGFGYIAKGIIRLDEQTDIPTLANAPEGYFYASISDGNGGWYVAGHYGTDGIYHLNKDLKKMENFTQNTIYSFSTDTRMLLCGNALYVTTQGKPIDINGTTFSYLYKLDAVTGQIDTSFHPQPRAAVFSLSPHGDTLFVGGDFDTIAGEFRSGLAAFNTKTGALLPWAPVIHLSNYESGFTGGKRSIKTIKMLNDILYIGGKFQISTPNLDKIRTGIYGLARYNLKTGNIDTAFHIHTSYYQQPVITGMDFSSNRLYFTGFFTIKGTNGEDIDNAAILNISSRVTAPVNNDFHFSYSGEGGPQVKILDNTVYFWGMGATQLSTGISRPNFVSLNASDNSLTGWNPQPNGNVYSFSVSNSKFLLSGGFYFLKSYPNNFGGINSSTLNYVTFPDLEDANDIVLSDKYIFIGGNFSKYNDSTVNGLARLKRKDLSYTPFPHKITNNNTRASIGCLSLGSEGLYVVGYYSNPFNMVGGNTRQNICLLDTETAELKTWHPPAFDGKVHRVFSFDSNVVIAGDFGLMPAWKRTKVAKINLSTNSIADWGPNISGYFPAIYTILVSGDTVYLGGKGIQKINSKDAGELSAVSATSGTLLPGFTPSGLSGGYGDDNISVLTKKGNSLYAAGDFKSVNSFTRNCLVKINATTGAIKSWDAHLNAGWNPVKAILALDTAVYIGGRSIQVDGNTAKGNLLKTDVSTGVMKKLFTANYNDAIRSFAVNEKGVIALAGDFKQGLFILDKARDSLVVVKDQPKFKYGLLKIASIGNVFVAAGNRKEEFGAYTEKPGFLAYDPEKDTVITSFSTPVMQGDIKTFAANEKTLIFGGEFEGMNSQIDIGSIAFMGMPDLYLKRGVTSWNPGEANTVDPFALSVYGSGFNSNSTIKLSMGNKNIVADSLNITDRKIIAYFSGTSFTTGKWNLEVKTDANTTENFPEAINIKKGENTEIWADWIGPDRTLANKPTTYYLLFGNRGNRDAYGVFLYVAVDKNQTVIYPNYIKPRPVENINWDTVPNYVNTDYFLGTPFTGKVYTVFVPYIPAHYEGSVRLTVTSTFSTHSMRVGISQPVYTSYDELFAQETKSTQNTAYNFFSCMYAVAGLAADLTPGLGCLKAAFDNTVLVAVDKYVKNQSIQAEDVANSIGMTALGCIPGEAALSKGFAIAKGMAGMYGAGADAGGAVGACGGFAADVFKLFPEITGFQSHDPNAKYGPQGINASSYLRSDMPYNYIVMFENDSAATAPAQRVIITDTLDKNVFDLTSFKATGFGFGDTAYMFKETDGDTVDIDMRPAKQIVVRVFYHLDAEAGILTWTFLTIDPNTYELVEDVTNGFLPPNRKSPEGEGNIFYSIRPLPNLTEGTEIKNSAHIVFDWNNEIPTDIWKNISDNIAPESAVKPLPDKTVDKDFTASWNGTDEGCGIYSYTIYVSENDSAYYPWILDTHDTSAVFSGEPGVIYKFYTIAIDSAGNKEAAPVSYDAMTRVSGTSIDNFGEGKKMQFRLYPNPAREQINMDCYLPESSSIRLDVLNVCGHTVMDPMKASGIRGTNKIRFDVSKLPPGYYFVRILTKYGVQIRKVIIQ